MKDERHTLEEAEQAAMHDDEHRAQLADRLEKAERERDGLREALEWVAYSGELDAPEAVRTYARAALAASEAEGGR